MLGYKDLWDCSVGGEDTSREMTHWCGNLLWVVIGVLCKILWRYKTKGLEKLRALKGKTGVVLVGNHASYFDVVFGYLTVRTQQWVRFMAKDDLFTKLNGLSGQIIGRVGAFPITRDSADRTALKRAARMLKNKEVVGIFPEGTRRGKGNVEPRIHAGAALIARMGKAPMMPFTVHRVDELKMKGHLPHFMQITVEFGDPVYLEWFDFLPKEDRLEACTWYVMRQCFAMKQHVPADQVDMAALFPNDRDFSEVFAQHSVGLDVQAGE